MTDISKSLANDDWPTLAEELERKSLQTLEKLMDKHAEGKISDRELYLVAGVIWDTVSGLAPAKVLRILEAVRKEIKGNAKRKKQ